MSHGPDPASLCAEDVEEAEELLKSVNASGRYRRLRPIFSITDYFIQRLSKRLRAEPDQIGIYDKRYVRKLQGKVFGAGQSESFKTKEDRAETEASDQTNAAVDLEAVVAPTLKDAQQKALETDEELRRLTDLRAKARAEAKEYTKDICKRRAAIRRNVKKGGNWRPDERLFHSPIFQIRKMGRVKRVAKEMFDSLFQKLRGFHRSNDHVRRMRAKVELEEITYTVETVTDPDTGKSVRASMNDVGPPNSQLTWSTLAILFKLHIEYAMPMTRIASMFGHPYFSSANQSRWLSENARIALPVYLELFDQLADSPLWSGDDTTTKVLKLEASEAEDALHKLVERELPFGFDLKNGKGKKSKLNVTFVTGRSSEDPRSVIRFYRTHLGSYGNLISELLSRRSPKDHRKVIIQGDLSTTNLPSKEFYSLFEILIAGCGSHCRRPFWEERDRIDACYFFLRGFLKLSAVEEDYGRIRFEDPKAMNKRTKYSRWIWHILRRGALTVINQKQESKGVLISYEPRYWPKDSKFYLACQYLVNHFDELTLYLKYPELEWTNNLSERAQRKEKLMLNSSFFRFSREGRAAFDIMKTIMATAQAAQIDFESYLRFLVVNKKDVQVNPQKYTPFAFATNQNPDYGPDYEIINEGTRLVKQPCLMV